MTVVPLPQSEASFEDFWREYPRCSRKIGRKLALALWDRITGSEGLHTRNLLKDANQYIPVHHQATPEEIIIGLRRWKRAALPLDGNTEFVPAPANWLNRGYWEVYGLEWDETHADHGKGHARK